MSHETAPVPWLVARIVLTSRLSCIAAPATVPGPIRLRISRSPRSFGSRVTLYRNPSRRSIQYCATIWPTPPKMTPSAIAMIGSNPAFGISGTSTAALRIRLTLYIAGDRAGIKKWPKEFSIPIQATATATKVRNGSMTRVNWMVSSSLPGTWLKSWANSRVRGSAKTIPRTTMTPVTTSSAVISCVPSRQAASRPEVINRRVKVGTKAELITPSAKRSRIRFGRRNAT